MHHYATSRTRSTSDWPLSEDTRQHHQARDDVDARILEALERQGITLDNGERARFEEIIPAEGHQVLTHRARGAGDHTPDTCIELFGPDETVNRFAERRALREAGLYEDTEILLLVGIGFEASHKTQQRRRPRRRGSGAYPARSTGSGAPRLPACRSR